MPLKLPLQPDEKKFLFDNYFKLTNRELTDHINSLRSSKNKYTISGLIYNCHKLGLKRSIQIRWSKSDENKLKAWYKIIGDKYIAELLTEFGNSFKIINGEKVKRTFNKKHIEKKRELLGLKRTKIEVSNIIKDNRFCREYKDFSSTDNLYTRGVNSVAKENEIRIWKGIRWIKINGKFTTYTRWYYHNFISPVAKNITVYHLDMDSLNDDSNNLYLMKKRKLSNSDYSKALKLLNKRVAKLKKESKSIWDYKNPVERKELMQEIIRIESIISKIKSRNKKEIKKESGFYEPINAF